MTAEERATQTMAAIQKMIGNHGEDWIYESPPEITASIAAAIRAAVKEFKERAAKVAEHESACQLAEFHRDPNHETAYRHRLASGACSEVARRIRELE